MTLAQWVRAQGGATPVSILLNVTPHAVRSWLKKRSVPRPKIMLQIEALTNKKLTAQKIISETYNARGNK